MIRALLPISLALGLGACAVGPEYEAPDTAAPRFVNADAGHFANTRIEAAWWSTLGDPVLDDLIERALAHDLDVRIAASRLAQARAIFREQWLDRLPTVSAHGAYDRRKEQVPGFGPGGGDARIESETFDAGFDAFWEIDLYGRVRRQAEAARAEAEAAEASLHAAQVSVAAEVARNYFELRGAERRYAVALANRGNQQEAVRITRVRYELGRGTELDLASARAQLAATEATLPPLFAAARAAEHRLAVLLATAPGTLELPDSQSDPISDSLSAPLAVGEPEALLRRRPDIRAAERQLAAATARIGVATADLFPQLSVSGFLGFITGEASELGDAAGEAWSVTPTLSWAAFDLGSVRARLHAAEAEADGALAAYEQVVLRALEETENAFVAYAQNQARLAALVEQAAASGRAAELARIRYREGAIEFLRLLDAERTLLEADDAVASAETALNTSVVAIYKALGGGWEVAPAVAAGPYSEQYIN